MRLPWKHVAAMLAFMARSEATMQKDELDMRPIEIFLEMRPRQSNMSSNRLYIFMPSLSLMLCAHLSSPRLPFREN